MKIRAGDDGFDPRALFEHNRLGVLLADAEGTVREANPVACGLLRRKRQDVVGCGVAEFFDPSDGRLAAAWEEQRSAGNFEGVLRLLRGDGTTFEAPVTVASYATGEADGEEGLFVALEHVDQEGAKDSTEWDSSPMRYLPDLVMVFEQNAVMRYASPSIEEILGYKPEEVAGVLVRGLAHPDDVPAMVDTMIDMFFNPTAADVPLAYRCRHKDGGWVHLEGVANNLLDEPAVEGVVINCRDVTERVRAEEEARRKAEDIEERVSERAAQLEGLARELRESEMRLLREGEEQAKAALEGAPFGLAYLRPDGRFDRANRKLRELLGHEDLQGLGLRDILYPDDLREGLELLQRARGPDETQQETAEVRCVRGDGRTAWVSLEVQRGPRSVNATGNLVLKVEDIDERKRAELALRSLTPREMEVLKLLKGRTNPEIAEHLAISARTAKFHVQNIIGKLGVTDRKQAAERASDIGFPPRA